MIDPTISQPIFEYARYIDAGDFKAVAELFRHGKIITPQGDVCGYDEVLAMYTASTRLYDNGTPCTRHVTSNLDIRQDGDTATCESYFTVFQALPDFPLQAIISGSYSDRLQRVDGHWQFVTRSMLPDLLGDLSRHLLFDPATLG